mmetsp:Transcript_3997/g.9572  ORF Transcript_3997/g.9572 Transcript_3997/m.9572 type:complete len:206 (+) Transcript_3997:377-994(+)
MSAWRNRSSAAAEFPFICCTCPIPRLAPHSAEKNPCRSASSHARRNHVSAFFPSLRFTQHWPTRHMFSPWSLNRSTFPRASTRFSYQLVALAKSPWSKFDVAKASSRSGCIASKFSPKISSTRLSHRRTSAQSPASHASCAIRISCCGAASPSSRPFAVSKNAFAIRSAPSACGSRSLSAPSNAACSAAIESCRLSLFAWRHASR